MKQLNFLINYLNENIPNSKLNILIQLLKKDEKQLYDTVLINNIITDIDGSKLAFNLKSSNSKYKKIKNSLIEKLFEMVLFVEPKIKGANDEYLNIINSLKATHAANILFITSNIQNVIPIIENKLKISSKNYVHSSSTLLSNYLVSHFGYVDYEKQKFAEYQIVLKKSLENYYQEIISNIYYSIAQSHFSKNRLVEEDVFLPVVKPFIEELKPFVGKVDSLTFHRNYFTLVMMSYHVKKEYDKVIETCDSFLKFIDGWPVKSFVLRKSMIRHKIEHLMLLKKFDESIILLKNLLDEETEGTNGWFNTYRFLILAHINKGNLQFAYDSILFVTNSNYYLKYKTGLKYLLGFIHLYLCILGRMGFIVFQNNETFNVKKFLKEFPNTTKDKSAMNIPIIIAQLFEAIISDNQGEVFDRIEALKKYSSRYITKNNNTRSNCFINMLIEVVKQNFHPIAIQRHADRYLKKLNSISQEDSNEAAEVEFIPYEYQWELLMIFLTNKKKNIRVK